MGLVCLRGDERRTEEAVTLRAIDTEAVSLELMVAVEVEAMELVLTVLEAVRVTLVCTDALSASGTRSNEECSGGGAMFTRARSSDISLSHRAWSRCCSVRSLSSSDWTVA